MGSKPAGMIAYAKPEGNEWSPPRPAIEGQKKPVGIGL